MAKKPTGKQPKGIGGWLILPTIGLFASALMWLAFALFFGMILISEPSQFNVTFFIGSIILAAVSIACIVLEFMKKKLFPKMAIVFLWAGVLFGVIVSSISDGDFMGVSRDVLQATLWTFYFLMSVRVNNTFVN